ncbi:SCY1-like protein 2 [Lobulomyces angularis]|nr:SCY1-like protein 2 [Lobulomyces angularis]
MGNKLTKEYEIDKDQVGSGGPGNFWKITNAIKISTGKNCSLFIYEKNSLEMLNPLTKTAQLKKEQDRVNDILKKEAQTLMRLRHPSLLEVTEALSEDRFALAFATEPIICNLSNVLGNFTNFSCNREMFQEKYELDELEIQKGILQLIKALQFLHTNKIIHGNVSPQAIYINSKGDWKLSGFNFSTNTTTTTTPQDIYHYLTSYPPYCAPYLEFLAPEYALEGKCELSSDVWSLGCLIYSLYHKGKSPLDCNQNFHDYKERLKMLDGINFHAGSIPPPLANLIKLMLTTYPSKRISIFEIQNNSFFDNILVSSIKFLETFVEKTQVEKAQFLKGLVRVLPQFSERLVQRKILPGLLNELKDKVLSPFIIPNLFWICEKMNSDVFIEKVLPSLKIVFKMTDPPQTIVLLLSRMDLFLKKVPSPELFRSDIMPLLYTGLEVPIPMVQEQALKAVNCVLDKLEFASIKSVLFTKIYTLYTSSQILAIKVNSLIAMHAMCKALDKFTLVDKLLPMLKLNRTREPGLLIAILAVYDEITKYLDKDCIAQDVLPELWKMALESQLNVTQFKKFMKVINELSKKVEELQIKHLETVSNIEGVSKMGDTITDFSKLVLTKQQIPDTENTNRSATLFTPPSGSSNTANNNFPQSSILNNTNVQNSNISSFGNIQSSADFSNNYQHLNSGYGGSNQINSNGNQQQLDFSNSKYAQQPVSSYPQKQHGSYHSSVGMHNQKTINYSTQSFNNINSSGNTTPSLFFKDAFPVSNTSQHSTFVTNFSSGNNGILKPTMAGSTSITNLSGSKENIKEFDPLK